MTKTPKKAPWTLILKKTKKIQPNLLQNITEYYGILRSVISPPRPAEGALEVEHKLDPPHGVLKINLQIGIAIFINHK